MTTNFLQIVFVIDESGSMQGSNSDVIGGFNSFIERHRNEPDARVNVSLYKFNQGSIRIFSNLPAIEVPNLTDADYSPNGFTALYDAIGQALSDTDKFIESLPETERPTTIMMVIITDGEENASHHYSASALKSAIETHEKLLNWKFIYLGADLNKFTDAEQLGISNTVAFKKRNMNSKFDRIAEAGIKYSKSGGDELDETQLLRDLED